MLLVAAGAFIELIVRLIRPGRSRYGAVAAVLMLIALLWGALATAD